ncbi:cupin domain-containing protein [Terrabacter sp. NPDC080008]|uniref:cupin domain-containing protein n=1 Tax=Terrabacter sp. NPDC080008 TaxID=3155176 RepID=UPI00344F06D7
MHVVAIDHLDAHDVTSFGSRGFGVIPVAAEAHVIVATLAPGGVIARHPAVVDQVLVMLSGEAEVSGEDAVAHVLRPGSAALWRAGESHETSSRQGMTALIVEADGIAATLAQADS